MTSALSEWITDNARLVIAVMIVMSAVVAAGIPMVERSTSLDQFQTDADESDALDYSDANFSTGTANTTTAQVIIQDDNVLDKETLVSILEYEQTLQDNKTINETLAEDDSMRSVANVIATSSIRTDRAEDLRTRENELSQTERALGDAIDSLADDPNADPRQTFDAVDANTSVTLTEEDYRLFVDAVENRRSGPDTNTTGDTQNEIVSDTEDVTQRILADEYATLSENKRVLENLDLSLEAQTDEVRSLNESQIDTVAAEALAGDTNQSGQALAFMPDYYEPGTTETNATLIVVSQETSGGSFAPGDAPSEIEDSQAAMAKLAPDEKSMSVLIYGDGIVSTEITDSMIDSVLLVGPLAVALVLLVLVVVYRDPLDILLGLLGISLVLMWTFGAMGWFDIPFSQPFIVVLVLLIGLSIDYGIHVVMRYREARAASGMSPKRGMAVALGSVGVALLYVTTTTVIGFLSNLTSPLAVFRDLGVVSAIGIVATLLVFGLLVPALKVELDDFFERMGTDRLKPAVGTGGGPVNRLLDTGATVAMKAPYVVIVIALLVSGVGAYGATDIDASFEQSDFLAEDPDQWLKDLPEPIAPGTYTAEMAIDTLDSDFVRQDTTATILVRGGITDPATLERIDRAGANASDMTATGTYADGTAAVKDPLTGMERVAANNETFNETYTAADTDGDGLPEENVTAVYDTLYRVAPEDAADVIHLEDGEYQAVRMVVTVDGSVDDATVRDQMEWIAGDIDGEGVSAIATGDVIVNQITADELAETAFLSLIVALLSVFAVLAVAYRFTEGSASLGVVTLVPVALTLTWVLGSMALLNIPFNIVTGMITGLTIGLGVDYSLHMSERFNQELGDSETVSAALHETVTGTGGALLASATTTASGFAVLLVAILPFLQSFGLITALTIVYAFLASVFVLPSLLVVWARFVGKKNSGRQIDNDIVGTETTATRRIKIPYALPDQSVPVTVALDGGYGRLSLRETVPGKVTAIDATPEPVAITQTDGNLTVCWEFDDEPGAATVSYTTEFTGIAEDGEEFVFEGTVEDESRQRSVEGDETVVIVGDIFQRVLERGEVIGKDIELAIERGDVTSTEVDRLRRAWLESE